MGQLLPDPEQHIAARPPGFLDRPFIVDQIRYSQESSCDQEPILIEGIE